MEKDPPEVKKQKKDIEGIKQGQALIDPMGQKIIQQIIDREEKKLSEIIKEGSLFDDSELLGN